MRRAPGNRKGSSLLEFTLVGVPFIFVLISTFEMARGMWIYHTLTYAVKEATRYAVVHGQNCAVSPNACTVSVGQITTRIRQAGPGLLPADMSVTLTASNGTLNCQLSDCLNNNNVWPTAPGNAVGSDIQISATYPFRSVICMFWPGAGESVQSIGTFNLPAVSREPIQF
jgi:Flp pilus assembly protein TadG